MFVMNLLGEMGGQILRAVWCRVFLEAWVGGITVDSRQDIAIFLVDNSFGNIECSAASNGQAKIGWACLYSPMPHVCTFHSQEGWEYFIRAKEASEEEIQDSLKRLSIDWMEGQPNVAANALRDSASSVDLRGAISMMANFTVQHWQPWVKEHVRSILAEEDIATVKAGPYVALHVRRGDKLLVEATLTESRVYLERAAEFLQDFGGSASVAAVKGIWLSSDDPGVFDEIVELSPRYFPNVVAEKIISITFRGPRREQPVRTTSMPWTYEDAVELFAEVQMLMDADVFVGTFTSNIGRLVAVLRDAQGHDRSTSISADFPDWHPLRA